MNNDKPIVFNKDAKAWKPKNQSNPDEISKLNGGVENIDLNKDIINSDSKINYNLNANEFKPKETKEDNVIEYVEDDADEDDDIEQQMNQADEKLIDELMKKEQVIEDEMSDDDNWFPKYKDCPCCKGFIYKCDGEVCKSIGECFCKSEEDLEDDL